MLYLARLPSTNNRLRVAILTLKNSSKLFEKMPKKRRRSITGTLVSDASCNTRSLKDNQLISRLINFPFFDIRKSSSQCPVG